MTKAFYLFCLLFCMLRIAECHVFDEKLFFDHLKNSPAIQQLYYPHLNGTLDLIDRILQDPRRTVGRECRDHLGQLKHGLLAKQKWALLCEYDHCRWQSTEQPQSLSLPVEPTLYSLTHLITHIQLFAHIKFFIHDVNFTPNSLLIPNSFSPQQITNRMAFRRTAV